MKPSSVSSGLVMKATKSPMFTPRATRSARVATLRSTLTSTCSQSVGWVSMSSPYACPEALSGMTVPVMNASLSSVKTRTRAPAANRAEKVPTGTSSSRPLSFSSRTMHPMVSAWTTIARSVVADAPGSWAVSAPRRVSVKGTPISSKVPPINCITASVRPDGLGVCSNASSVSTIQLRSVTGIRGAVDVARSDMVPLGSWVLRLSSARRDLVATPTASRRSVGTADRRTPVRWAAARGWRVLGARWPR